MNYYLDTEFLEGTQKKRFLGIAYGETKSTIDLISIGIVSEDGREYYAVSKDFNLKEAWGRYQMKQVHGDARNRYPDGVKECWIRENVLKPIFRELLKKYTAEYKKALRMGVFIGTIINEDFSYKLLKFLINRYGKNNQEIAEEVKEFCYNYNPKSFDESLRIKYQGKRKINFYAYYADYDWVVFCWLFGKMIDLPTGFPMYSNDLKQVLDEKIEKINSKRKDKNSPGVTCKSMKQNNPSYPKQIHEHNSLADARWNKKLHEFLKSI